MKFLIISIALAYAVILNANDQLIEENNKAQRLFIEDDGEVFVNVKSLAPATVSSLGVNSEASAADTFKAKKYSLQVALSSFSDGDLKDDAGSVFGQTTMTGVGLTYRTKLSNDFSFLGKLSSANGQGYLDDDFVRDFIGDFRGGNVDLSRKEVGLGIRYNVFQGAFLELAMTRVLIEAEGFIWDGLFSPSVYMRTVGNSLSISPGYNYQFSESFYMEVSMALVYTSVEDIEIDTDQDLLASGRFSSFVANPQVSLGVTF
jgi:hypothetical protein